MGKPTIAIGENKGLFFKAQISFAVTAKLISAFVFATRIVQFLYFLNPKFTASNHLLCLYSPVCVGPVRKPPCWFSDDTAQIMVKIKPNNILNSHGEKTVSCLIPI